MLPTVPAPARPVGLHVLGVELLFRQVGEADADGSQSLGEVRLHDIAQEPHPKLLRGEGGISRGVPWPREEIGQLPSPILQNHAPTLTASAMTGSAACPAVRAV